MKGRDFMSILAAKASTMVNIAPNIYTVVIRPCTNTIGYYAVCDTPNGGCVAQGTTLQEVQKNMIEAMELHLEDFPDVSNYYLSFEVQHAQDTDN